MLSEYLLIGQVLRPQGIQGQVKVRPDTADQERFLDLTEVFLKKNDQYVPVSVDDVSVRDDAVYLRLNGATTRNEAETQRDWMLYVDRAHAVELMENENFICDLIGCDVVDTKGSAIGKIKEVLQPGGNDVYVITTPQGEMLLPALKFVVPEVDVEHNVVTVDESRLREVAVCSWIRDDEVR